jgi:serine protease Do
MRIHTLGFPGRAFAIAGVTALLVATTPVVYGQQTVKRAPIDELSGPFFGSGPQIGVTVRDVTADDGAGSARAGAVVDRVRGEGPAAKAGVQAGDIIVTYDGEAVRSARQLARLIEETPEAKAVPVTVTRSGKRIDLSVTPESRNPWGGLGFAQPNPLLAPDLQSPDLNLMLRPRGRGVLPGLFVPASAGRLGIQTQDLTDQLGEYFGAADGVLVTSVSDSTPARTAGLRAGDVITKVDGQNVEDTAALRQRLVGKTGKVELTVVRDRSERTISVEMQGGASRSVAPRRYER